MSACGLDFCDLPLELIRSLPRRQNGAWFESAIFMVDLAPERVPKPSDDHQSPRVLPYDPKEWEQRVAAARAQREKVLQQRSRDARRAEGSSGAAFSGAASRDDQPRPKQSQTVRRLPAALPGGAASTAANRLKPASPLRATPIQADMAPGSRQTGGRFKPLLAGLLLGGVAGASLVGFVAIGLGGSDLRMPAISRALPSSLAPASVAPSVDASASSLPRQPPPPAESEPALVDFAAPTSVATVFALPGPLETLGPRETEPLVSTEAALVVEPPKVLHLGRSLARLHSTRVSAPPGSGRTARWSTSGRSSPFKGTSTIPRPRSRTLCPSKACLPRNRSRRPRASRCTYRSRRHPTGGTQPSRVWPKPGGRHRSSQRPSPSPKPMSATFMHKTGPLPRCWQSSWVQRHAISRISRHLRKMVILNSGWAGRARRRRSGRPSHVWPHRHPRRTPEQTAFPQRPVKLRAAMTWS